MKHEKFTCAKCKKTYPKMNNDEWNDEKATEEFLNNYPECVNDQVDLICDPCYVKFKCWFNALTKTEKETMRKEWNLRSKNDKKV